MISFFIIAFSTIGFIVSVLHISTFCFSLNDKFRESRERKQANDKRLIALLEAINLKLNAKP